MDLNLSRTVECGAIKGTHASHVAGLSLIPCHHENTAWLFAMNSHDLIIARFSLRIPDEDIRRLAQALTDNADKEQLP